jgi:hypothetical protein
LKQEIKVLEAFNSNHHNLAGYKYLKDLFYLGDTSFSQKKHIIS